MSLFFFGNNFSKNKETFKIFSPQILEIYRILLMETSLESIMFCYTFSIINTMFVPCIVLLYDNTAATWTLKLSTTLLSISCGILSCQWIAFTNSVFQLPPLKRVEILGIGWLEVIGFTRNVPIPWEVMPEVIKYSVREMRYASFLEQNRKMNTSGITSHGTDSFHVKPITPSHFIPKISNRRTIFWGSTWNIEFENNPQTRGDIIRKEIRWIPEEMLNRVVDSFNVRAAALLSYSSAGAWKEHSINYWKSTVKHWF